MWCVSPSDELRGQTFTQPNNNIKQRISSDLAFVFMIVYFCGVSKSLLARRQCQYSVGIAAYFIVCVMYSVRLAIDRSLFSEMACCYVKICPVYKTSSLVH